MLSTLNPLVIMKNKEKKPVKVSIGTKLQFLCVNGHSLAQEPPEMKTFTIFGRPFFGHH